MTRKRKKTDPEAEATDEMEAGDVNAEKAGDVTEAMQGELAELTGDGPDKSDSASDGAPEDGPASAEPDRVVRDAAVASVSGGRVDVSDSLVLSVAAGTVEAKDTLIVVGTAGELGGDAKVLFDSRSAMLFGAAVGLVLALIGALLRGGCGDDTDHEGDCCDIVLEPDEG